MANPEHFAKLKEGVESWNRWRRENPSIRVDLHDASVLYLHEKKTIKIGNRTLQTKGRRTQLSGIDLSGAYLRDANLSFVNLDDSDLTCADLKGCNLRDANLRRVRAENASFEDANLRNSILSGAMLSGANFTRSVLADTNLEGTTLTNCCVYGVSAWNVALDGAIQSNLIITRRGEPIIQVDNLEVAQFIYLLLNNKKIRHVIDTITSKVVLILGRFTSERKPVLEAIRNELRKRDLLPLLFDFEKPAGKDLTGTVSTLANLARFVIVDLTDPSSVPHELATIVPATVVPIQAILLEGRQEYAMFGDLKRRYHWVLEPVRYADEVALIATLDASVIAPAEAMAKALAAGS